MKTFSPTARSPSAIKAAISIFSSVVVTDISAEEEDTSPPPALVQPQEPEPDPTQYTLTVTAGDGGTVSTEGGEYQEGTEIEIIATPNEEYRFDGWEGNDSYENTLIITISSDTELSPIFIPVTQTPSRYGVDEYWGKIVEFEPEIFFSQDIPESLCQC